MYNGSQTSHFPLECQPGKLIPPLCCFPISATHTKRNKEELEAFAQLLNITRFWRDFASSIYRFLGCTRPHGGCFCHVCSLLCALLYSGRSGALPTECPLTCTFLTANNTPASRDVKTTKITTANQEALNSLLVSIKTGSQMISTPKKNATSASIGTERVRGAAFEYRCCLSNPVMETHALP